MEVFLVQNIMNGGKEAKIQAAMEVGNLSGKQKHKLIEKGIISPVISMLQSQDYILIEAALSALLSLACGSERNKIQIVKSGILPVLLELLHHENKALVELVVAALLILSSCTANKLEIMSYGAIPLLVELLAKEYGDDSYGDCISIQAKLDAVSTLHNLSMSEQTIPFIVSSGLVVKLLQLAYIHEKSSDLVEKAMGLLEHIASSSATALLQTANTVGAIQALVETIEEGTHLCKQNAIGILLLIGQNCEDKYRRIILRAGVMPGLLQLSVDGTWRAKSMAQELLLLLRECSGCESSKQSKNEIVEQIMQEIDANGENMMESTMTMLVQEMIAKLRA